MSDINEESDKYAYNSMTDASATGGPISVYDIEALIDNELSEGRKIQVLADLKKDPDLQKIYDELLQQKEMLQMWWKNADRTT